MKKTKQSDIEKYPFCAAPWAEGVLGINGELRPCSKLPTNLLQLDWRETGLENAYNSKAMIQFREKIIAGTPPHPYCQTCIDTGTTRLLDVSLKRAYRVAINEMKKINDVLDYSVIYQIKSILSMRCSSNKSMQQIDDFRSICNDWAYKHPEIKGYISKLLVVLRVCESYLNRDITVPVIASFRQVSLKLKCNAKCIHCPGKYSGWINSKSKLDVEYYDEAFSHEDDITDFFMNGAEFLFVDDWKEITKILKRANVKAAISTNGILLTKSNIKYLIDNECMDSLNVSLDGGTKETIETIRSGLNYDILMKNLEYLFKYAYEKKYQFSLSFSFVLMKSNYTEFPELIRVMSELKKKISPDNIYPTIGFGCASLDQNDVPGYNEFAAAEHIDSIEHEELKKVFDKCKQYSDLYNVSVEIFVKYNIDSYISEGYPIPKRALHHMIGK